MPLIDPKTAQPGTIGYLPPAGAFEFEDDADFEWYKDPASQYVLGKDGRWYLASDQSEAVFYGSNVKLYDNWPEAVRDALDRDAQEYREEIAEAEKSLKHVEMVRKYLKRYVEKTENQSQ